MTAAKEIVLANSPEGLPNPKLGESSSTFSLQTIDLPDIKDGQLLVRSNRQFLNPNQETTNAFTAPMQVGDRMKAYGIAKVSQSKDASVAEGDLVAAWLGWVEKAVVDAKSVRVLPKIPGLSPTSHLGLLGFPSLTAYAALKGVLELKEGQTIIISGATGAVGNIAVQLAKHVFKAKVIAIAGSTEKCKWLLGVGADVAVNYKDSSFEKALAGSGSIDCFLDLVGGNILDACIPFIKPQGQIAAAGATSSYNDASQSVIKNWWLVITNSLTIKGFSISSYMNLMEETMEVVGGALKDGKLKSEETILRCSFEELPITWMELFSGDNKRTGKLISQVADL
ncbi:NAD(P)-binding protein [Rhodocollybia butyracea]|uniref:NAD(P)-binding protein n=1 Tax=Rhodocollybia butyracea TaxID=206335 RepID=A0A9P5PKX6_9AGAR|nr:NAD(P)-binding protein [Rhodocollybia butyracea]